MAIFLILAIVVAIIAVSFALMNAQLVTVSLLFIEFQSSLALILLVTLAIGILIGFLGLTPGLVKKRMEISRQKKHIQQLEKQIQDLHSPAISPPATAAGDGPSVAEPPGQNQ